MKPSVFADGLLRWYDVNPRPMPWLEAKDPYKIWISEIILQQTRVTQGWSYYLRFIETFPDVFALHEAEDSEVLKAWEGLGYYTRARNLKKAASIIVNNHGGIFPDSYPDIIRLPGIGPYTAAAVSGFAFELPYAVIDGNVTRLISRLLCIEKPVDSREGKEIVSNYVNEAIMYALPSRFNQAIMNFGALVCKPQSPDCPSCPFIDECKAFAENKLLLVPIRLPKISKKIRFFHYFILHDKSKGHIGITQRLNNDIWKGLFEFPLVEKSREGILNSTGIKKVLKAWNLRAAFISNNVFTTRQELTHQKITFYFYFVDLRPDEGNQNTMLHWIEKAMLEQLAMPVTLKNVIHQKVNAWIEK